MPDLLRVFALFGIVVVNVHFLAFPFADVLGQGSVRFSVDGITVWLVSGLAGYKSYGLFSFMFGVGLGLLMRSAERRGLAFGKLYRRRMLGLILLGLLHGVLFFPGDILVTYGLWGFALFFMRNWPVRRLIGGGLVFLVLPIVVASSLIFAYGAAPDYPELLAFEIAAMSDGAWIDVVIFRAIMFVFVGMIVLFIQGISALGWFLLGYAAVKSGVLSDPGAKVWSLGRRWALSPGVALSLLASWAVTYHDALWGDALLLAAAPLATFGYLGLIAKASHAPAPWLSRLLTAGGASLTIYLGQSIVLSTLFAPYGGGLWNDLGATAVTVIAISVTVALFVFVLLWRRRFSQGPFEWLLRWFTYRTQRP